MRIKPSIPRAAGLCLGSLIAAPAAAQISTAGNLLLQQGVDGILDEREAGDLFGTTLAWGDFNGDGFADLAIGVPDEGTIGGVERGCLQVVYGGPAGLTTEGDQRIFRSVTPGAGNGHDGDRMGHALTAGDFDGDGFDDVAIGIPGDVVSGEPLAGSVIVLHGSPGGLIFSAQLWNQDEGSILDAAEAGDSFGAALAAGDFDGDGFDELAIGAPFEAFGAELAAGAVHVLRGSPAGLTGDGNLLIDRASFGAGPPEFGDHFGAALAVGNFDSDDFADLVIGAPDEPGFDPGQVFVAFGTASGLDPTDPSRILRLVRSDLGCPGGEQAGDRFGAALAVGNFDIDADDDLAIGIPGAEVNGSSAAGEVAVFYPDFVQLGGSGNPGDCFSQAVSGVGGGLVFSNERFGASLAAGDLTGNGAADLVVGVPGERLGLGAFRFGGFHVFHGSSVPLVGLEPATEPFWTQSSIGIAGGIETDDAFAFALALGDANGDGFADLAVGVPGEEIDNDRPNHGAIHVLYNGPRIFADGFEGGDLSAWSSFAP